MPWCANVEARDVPRRANGEARDVPRRANGEARDVPSCAWRDRILRDAGRDREDAHRSRHRRLRRVALAAVLCLGLFAMWSGPSPAAAAGAAPAPFTDAELIDGFVRTVFGAEREDVEGESASARLVKKFTGPIAYHIVSTAREDHRPTVRAFVQNLGTMVANLDLYETPHFTDAQVAIFLTDRAGYAPTIRSTVWEGVDVAFLEGNACSAVIEARRARIERSYIYLVADEGDLGLAHCLVEEVAQGLGPANDSDALAYSIFNDRSELNTFGIFDWFILNMLYDPRVRPGMTEAEVLPLLPQVIADARARLPLVLRQSASLAQHEAARR